MQGRILVVWEYDNPLDSALVKAYWLATRLELGLSLVGYSGSRLAIISNEELLSFANQTIGKEIELTSSAVIAANQINRHLLQTVNDAYQLVVKTCAKYDENSRDEADWQLIRQLQYPLLLTMNRKWQYKNFRILVTLDIDCDSPGQNIMNLAVLNLAQSAQKSLNAELHAAYVIGIAKPLTELGITESDEVLHRKGDASQRLLDKTLAEAGINNVESHVLAGAPEDEISRLANKKKYDLVIMGSVGRKGLKGILLGNTAEKTIENLRQDLLIIKPS